MRIFKDLWWFFVQEKKAYGIGILMLLCVALLELVPPKVIGIVVDLIITNELTTRNLFLWSIVLISAGIFMYGLRYVWRVMIFGASVKLAKQLRDDMFSHFTKMPPSF